MKSNSSKMEQYDNLDVSKTITQFETEISDTGYVLDLTDEDTLIEVRRCLTFDLEKLCETGPLNPSNPLYGDLKLCEKTPGKKCGLYHCECYEESEWYTGKCSYCEEYIESKKKAKRIPYYYGGFKGCFCSNTCLHECLSENTAAIEHVLIELMQYFQNIIDAYEEEEFNSRNEGVTYYNSENDTSDEQDNEDVVDTTEFIEKDESEDEL
jgi:hypothetical protein